MIIFYHGDMDGIVSAHLYFKGRYDNSESLTIKFIEFEYDKEKDILTMPIAKYIPEEIVFVDCCPNEEILQYLIKINKNITILDHHISKKPLIDAYCKEGLIDGMSYIGASGSLITWCWFKFNKDISKIIEFLDIFGISRENQDRSNVPLSIKLVNSWDIWNGLYIEAEAYKTYFECQNFKPRDKEINLLLDNNLEIQKAVINGNMMLNFYHNWGEQYCQRYGYAIQYQDKRIFVLNVGNANSKIFGERIHTYDAVMIYCYNGEKYKCSIYSNKEDFDCSTFAEALGGGGHKGAAGFVIDEIPDWLRGTKDEKSKSRRE